MTLNHERHIMWQERSRKVLQALASLCILPAVRLPKRPCTGTALGFGSHQTAGSGKRSTFCPGLGLRTGAFSRCVRERVVVPGIDRGGLQMEETRMLPTTSSEAISNLWKEEPLAKRPTDAVLRQLSEEDIDIIDRRLSESVECVYNPIFESRD